MSSQPVSLTPSGQAQIPAPAPSQSPSENRGRSKSSCAHTDRTGHLGTEGDMGAKTDRTDICPGLGDRRGLCQVGHGSSGKSSRGPGGLLQLRDHSTSTRDHGHAECQAVSEWQPPIRESRKPIVRACGMYKLASRGNNKCGQIGLLEVYAYPNSKLTETANRCGLKAKRFTMQDGDLSTKATLLSLIILHQPRHEWLSPECGPWSAWNRFKSQRSLQRFARVQKNQEEARVHLKLCQLICHLQIEAGRHAHTESPWTAELWNQSEIREFVRSSLEANFDQSMLGLRHLVTNMSMQKKTRVQTTSREMFETLEQRICDHQHEHSQIAGPCRVGQEAMPVSKFAGHYPIDFAKAIIKAIMGTKGSPIERPIYHIDDHDDEPPRKRAKIQQAKDDDAEPMQTDDSSPWQEVFKTLTNCLPKSGVHTWTNPTHMLFESVRKVVPGCRIGAIKAGKGLDRYIPGEHVWQQELPMRHTIVKSKTLELKTGLTCPETSKCERLDRATS